MAFQFKRTDRPDQLFTYQADTALLKRLDHELGHLFEVVDPETYPLLEALWLTLPDSDRDYLDETEKADE